MNSLTPPLQTINGKSVFLWRGYYWEKVKSIKHDCGRWLTIYRKFRKWKGELQEIKQGYRMCPECASSY